MFAQFRTQKLLSLDSTPKKERKVGPDASGPKRLALGWATPRVEVNVISVQ